MKYFAVRSTRRALGEDVVAEALASAYAPIWLADERVAAAEEVERVAERLEPVPAAVIVDQRLGVGERRDRLPSCSAAP